MPEDLVVLLGKEKQKESIFAAIYTRELWKAEPFRNKLKSIITIHWQPNEKIIQQFARETLLREVFGSKADYGDKLFELIDWHHSRKWKLDHLTKIDKMKSDAFNGMTGLTRIRFWELLPVSFNLKLFERAPQMCVLVDAMVVKIPVVSFQYYMDIHMSFAFNSIRKAGHPLATDLISYIYDLQFIQQKIAISLHEFLRLVIYAENQKENAFFINAEINAIMGADLVFSYLKASIEKIILVVAITHGIKNLDGKKEHRQKLNALKEKLPKHVKNQHYCQFILEFIESENLSELNNYRSGILHKKGISDLQPHNYVGSKASDIPLRKIFEVLVEQHSKNTAMLLGAYALLTDELVRKDPPNINPTEIPN
ncbi:hypothetical protein SAMN04488029_0160 [Reichenbachiella faecimaris]|uniref:Uncharacterized protein n=1 Tax=Reichenbachiella faecimaris TaxID=692418 RepID=A0A1W2G5V1_REIFA|nr:hypothetical protein [Reichenbachiella faecimaris]SMD31822.1 hypothetical protein SAMN04488029_0160 [Reichenbachiella faecimaris]